jgi:uncharacterized membrane protein YkoI
MNSAKWHRTVVSLLTPVLAAIISTNIGFGDEDHDRARQLRHQGVIQPLQRILRHAHSLHPGRVLEVELEEEQGHYIYEIELLDARGRVWNLEFDARTGRLVEDRERR